MNSKGCIKIHLKELLEEAGISKTKFCYKTEMKTWWYRINKFMFSQTGKQCPLVPTKGKGLLGHIPNPHRTVINNDWLRTHMWALNTNIILHKSKTAITQIFNQVIAIYCNYCNFWINSSILSLIVPVHKFPSIIPITKVAVILLAPLFIRYWVISSIEISLFFPSSIINE